MSHNSEESSELIVILKLSEISYVTCNVW